MSSFNPLSFTLAYHTLHTYPLYGLFLIVKVCALAACSPPGSVCLYWISCYISAGRNGLPPTPDTLHFRCSYCLHPSHPFLSTWGAVMLEKKKNTKKKKTLKGFKIMIHHSLGSYQPILTDSRTLYNSPLYMPELTTSKFSFFSSSIEAWNPLHFDVASKNSLLSFKQLSPT